MNIKPLGFNRQGLPSSVNFPLTMAPMVGLSHCAFRQLVREYLPQNAVTLWPSEMLNSRRIPSENLKLVPETMTMGHEDFWIPQILANEEEKIKLSLEKLFLHGAQGIDINMGCPVKKALKHNYGVSLMGDSDYAADVVRTTVRYSKGPVAVKLRGTEESKKEEWLNFTLKLEKAGANWLTLHPRTAAQKRRGSSDWSQIKELKNHLSIPVIGNGDIQIASDVIQMIHETHCDMVMAGRVLTARPWLFWQLGYQLGWPNPHGRSGPPPTSPEEEGFEYGQSLLRLIDLMSEIFPGPLAYRKFLFHVRTGCVWLPFGHSLYSELTSVRTLSDSKVIVQKFFNQSHSMSEKTFLRQ